MYQTKYRLSSDAGTFSLYLCFFFLQNSQKTYQPVYEKQQINLGWPYVFYVVVKFQTPSYDTFRYDFYQVNLECSQYFPTVHLYGVKFQKSLIEKSKRYNFFKSDLNKKLHFDLVIVS